MRDPGLRQPDGDNLRTLVRAARADGAEARNMLIEKYQPFILKTAAAVSRRYLRPGEDDEISVAMMAFNEAIDSYNLQGNVPFLPFAEIVVRRRLVDFFRSQAARHKELPLSSLGPETDEEQRDAPRLHALAREAENEHIRVEESIERREEILRFRAILDRYGLSFETLMRTTPKHADSRERLIEVARAVAGVPRLVEQIKRRRALPINEAALISGLSRKTIERHRHYILAVILVLINDLPHMQSFL